ncbi:MAG: bifunctional enoyl-CoA hydratase/phosphate acetyltransferase [Mogibacterium sp.]|nr:bifunctional enoyl-CoA hydratase/phosphate acetyltransferase [Mogibacterium sp.]
MLRNLKEMAELVKANPIKKRIVLACAHDEHSLDAVYEAFKEGIVDPILVGRESEIREIMEREGFDFGGAEKIYDIEDDIDCAKKAVSLIREGEGDFMMKGRMQTADLLKQVVNKEKGLQVGKIMSHVGIFEIPNYHKLVAMTDGGMLLAPDLEKKAKVINNAVETMQNMGYENPKVAVLCAAEKLNEKAPESVDAAALKEMNESGEILGCIVEGPISYDIAFSKEIADFKGFESPVAGDADILIVPNMAAGNMLGKSWTITAGGIMAGIIVGAKVPIVLTSRGATADEKFYSIVFAAAGSNASAN